MNKIFTKKIIIFTITSFVLIGLVYTVSLFRISPDKSSIDFLDIGQGDAILVRQGWDEMLIDGGQDRSILAQLGKTRPFLDRKIEYVVGTHPHDDHVIGLLDIFGRYDIGEIILPRVLADGQGYIKLLEKAKKFNVPVMLVSAGEQFIFGNMALTVLWPEDDCLDRLKVLDASHNEHDPYNTCSLVMRYDHCNENGCRRALLMADATSLSEELMMADGTITQADILKIGHHGSRFATTSEFLSVVKPKDSVIQVGEKNNFGHPNYGVLLRLKNISSKIWRNDLHGPIRAVPEGGGFRVGP